jgi:amidase
MVSQIDHDILSSSLPDLIAARSVSSEDVTLAMLQRIERLDPHLGSYITVTGDYALEQARRADKEIAAGRRRSPLHGVPIGLKDLIETDFAPTTVGMGVRVGVTSPTSATVVRRLEAAGAVIIGKQAMTEGALSEHHPELPTPVNPWSAEHWAGFSSSGTGVAVAAGLCFGALGSDTGGSIRFPSSANGVTGLMPTRGRVSLNGVFPFANSMDRIGPMAQTAAGVAAILSVVSGYDETDPMTAREPVPDYLAEIGGGAADVVLGVDERFLSEGVRPEVQEMVREAIAVLVSLGARVRPLSLPDHHGVAAAWITIAAVEYVKAHAATYPAQRERYGPAISAMIDSAERISAHDLSDAYCAARYYVGALDAALHDANVLVLPVLQEPTPRLDQMEVFRSAGADIARFTVPFSVSGHPTLTLPGGFHDGVPQGFQLVGKRFGEKQLLQLGHAFQQATTWHASRPPL